VHDTVLCPACATEHRAPGARVEVR
jgi:hypothetical protein